MTQSTSTTTPRWRGCDYRENDGHLCIERDGEEALRLYRAKGVADSDFRVLVNDIVERLNQGAGQADAVAWLHKICEPGGCGSHLFSFSSDNPWSHWLESHRAECVYSAQPLFTHPPAASARVAELEAALRSVMALKPARDAFHYLDRGIGTKTQEGIDWLAARAALAGGRT